MNGRFDRDLIFTFSPYLVTKLDSNWALRYEGHHLAYNWTFVSGVGIASSPQFFGSNPAEVRAGNKAGTRVLAAEEDLGRDLVSSLSATKRAQLFWILTCQVTYLQLQKRNFASRKFWRSIKIWILGKRMLIALIDELASMQPEVIADARMETIRSEGLDDIKFVWIGGTERGDPHYFRVQAF